MGVRLFPGFVDTTFLVLERNVTVYQQQDVSEADSFIQVLKIIEGSLIYNDVEVKHNINKIKNNT